MRELKTVICGDGAVGKSTFLEAYTGVMAERASQEVSKEFLLDEDEIHLDLVDIGADTPDTKKKTEAYADASFFLICYSIISPASYESVIDKWYPEIRKHSEAPVYIVATKVDLRNNEDLVARLRERKMAPVSEKQGSDLRKSIEARGYFEVSALEPEGLTTLVEEVIRDVVGKPRLRGPRKSRRTCVLV